MPSEDTGTDMSEMRKELDTVQVGASEELSEMQDASVGYAEEDYSEDIRYRVTMGDWGAMENETLYEEYFTDYPSAYATYKAICDDDDFLDHYDRSSVMVILWKAYRGYSQIFWEVIKRSIAYKDSE